MMSKNPNFITAADRDPLQLHMGSRLFFLKMGLLAGRRLGGRIFSFYLDGFRRMGLGRLLWIIILVKLLIMFGVLKLFFFPDYLHDNFAGDAERAEHVMTNLTEIPTRK